MKRTLALSLFIFAACQPERFEPPAATPVRVEALQRSDFAPSIALVGTVRAAQTVPLTATQRGTVTLAPRFASGLRTGESVRAGELIAVIANDQVAFSRTQARLQMEAALASHELIERSFRDGVVSRADFTASSLRTQLARETYAAAQREAGELRITAPLAGHLVVHDRVASGAKLDAGVVLADVAAGGAPRVEAEVAAGDRELLRPGQAVRLEGPGGWKGSGKITEVASVIDAAGTARVIASIDSDVAPAPGTGVDLHVELDRRADVLTVPDDAIVAGAEGPAVFVLALNDGMQRWYRVKRADVETGGRANGRVEVKSGLRDGDRVVVSGADALTDDSLVVETETTAVTK
jgi:membrane fusion protein, multidrug efflux system